MVAWEETPQRPLIPELTKLEALLTERDRLWKLRIIYEGGSERDPNWSGEDQRRYDQIQAESKTTEEAIRSVAASLRSRYSAEFRTWLDQRNAIREDRLRENPPKWEANHLRGTSERWELFLAGDDDDFFLHIGW